MFQESAPGEGDFAANSLGTFRAPRIEADAAGLYRYRANEYNGALPLVRDRSHVAFLEAKEGLLLIVIHDDGKAGNGGGQASVRIDIAREARLDFQGLQPRLLVEDEPNGANDRYERDDGGFVLQNRWINGYTDGVVIGPFFGAHSIDVRFAPANRRWATIRDLTGWVVLRPGESGGPIDLALEPERRVRFVVRP